MNKAKDMPQVMDNETLDRRIGECATLVRKLVDDLKEESPNVEHAIALGVLLSCSLALSACCYEDDPQPAQLTFALIKLDV